jgi:hypothetical protein
MTVARLGYDITGRPLGSGLLPAAAALKGPDAETRATLGESWRAYQTTSRRVRNLASISGDYPTAVRVAIADGSVAFNRFDGMVEAAFTASQQRFQAQLSSAGNSLDGLAVSVTAALALAAVLSLVGLQMRINEYR